MAYCQAGKILLTDAEATVNAANQGVFASEPGYIARLKLSDAGRDSYVYLPGHGGIIDRSSLIVDRTLPLVSIMVPRDGAEYDQYCDLGALWYAGDDVSGIRSATGTMPAGSVIDTSDSGQL